MRFTIRFDQERNIWVAYNQDEFLYILLSLHISTYLHMISFNTLLMKLNYYSLNYLHMMKLLFSLMHYFYCLLYYVFAEVKHVHNW